MGSFGKGSLQKVFCKFRKISAKKIRRISAPFPDATKRIFSNFREFSVEILQTFRKNPFANDPILSELLNCGDGIAKSLKPLFKILLAMFLLLGIQSPKGPKIEKIQDRPPGLKVSSKIENFKRATHQTPIFVGNSEGRDWTFQARLKFLNEIEKFKRDWFFSIFGPLGLSRDRLCPKRVLPERLFWSQCVVNSREVSHKWWDFTVCPRS